MEKYLAIYINDHLGGSTTGLELAKRAAKNNRGDPEFGPALERIASEIEDDRDGLKRIMAQLGVGEDRIKETIGWAMEKAARLKPNGELLKFSPLSRLVEIEGLLSGVSGKHSLWKVLLDVQDAYPELDGAQLAELEQRAEDQRARLYELRGAAARIAFMP
jgi:hypothetical protein